MILPSLSMITLCKACGAKNIEWKECLFSFAQLTDRKDLRALIYGRGK
jgi:hypothetical protein